jgi:hypothetical protein
MSCDFLNSPQIIGVLEALEALGVLGVREALGVLGVREALGVLGVLGVLGLTIFIIFWYIFVAGFGFFRLHSFK